MILVPILIMSVLPNILSLLPRVTDLMVDLSVMTVSVDQRWVLHQRRREAEILRVLGSSSGTFCDFEIAAHCVILNFIGMGKLVAQRSSEGKLGRKKKDFEFLIQLITSYSFTLI
jgi:hypothetical protein